MQVIATITSLKQYFPSKKIRIEILDAMLVILWVVVVGMIALYYQVFWIEIQDLFGMHKTGSVIEETAVRSLAQWGEQSFGWVQLVYNQNTKQEHQAPSVDQQLDALKARTGLNQSLFAYELSTYLEWNVAQYDLPFTMVPPGRFISIPSLGVQAPIETIPFATPEQIEQGDFYEELKKWVVKYPFTGTPGSPWNTLIFGHSSVDALQADDNDYGYIFYKLPKLQKGDLIQVVRDGEMFEYEVTEKLIKRPKDVPAEVNQKTDVDMLTLMACYPLLSDAQRILIKALPKKPDQPILPQLTTTQWSDASDS